jgi:DNA helicase-2/ATP-dependent DNA helicase PcrA
MSDTALIDDQAVDADADRIIRDALNLEQPKSFFLYAGAGSGKTRSLVEALGDACVRHGRRLALRNQKIAVITYTNKARDEIDQRLEYDPRVEVATIHAFAWALIKGFDSDIREWLRVNLAEEIQQLEDEEARGRKGTKTSLNRQQKIVSKTRRLERLDGIARFVYSPTGDNRSRESLNHTEVIAMTAAFLSEKPGLQRLLVTHFPILLIDESQDTTRRLMDAFLTVAAEYQGAFTLGLFGDTMQRIYADGKEDLANAIPDDWERPEKVMNFRCPKRVIELINAIRADVDGKAQRARSDAPEGVVRVFIAGFANDKPAFEAKAARRMAEITGDEAWAKGDEAIKTLALEHLMAARRFGFEQFFAPLYAEDRLRTGLLDGTGSGIAFLLSDVLPLADALGTGDAFSIASVVRRISPLLDKEQLAAVDPEGQRKMLQRAREGTDALKALLEAEEPPSIEAVLTIGEEHALFAIPEVLAPYLVPRLDAMLLDGGPGQDKQGDEEEPSEVSAWGQALAAPFSELAKYDRYVRGLSQFDTHQGVKGLEFPRVMIVINDEEMRGFMFNYGKLLGTHEKSKTDRDNEAAGKETSIDRTRRLFYVTCSRAEESLAIVYYSDDPPRARQALLRLGWFASEEIELADEAADGS